MQADPVIQAWMIAVAIDEKNDSRQKTPKVSAL